MKLQLSWILAVAPVLVLGEANLCCLNGVYTDDPQLICKNPEIPNYGDLQCYGEYQIECTGYFAGDPPTSSNASLGTQSIASCLQFCREYAPGFSHASVLNANYLNPSQGYSECTCIPPGSFENGGDYGASVSHCLSG